MGCRPRRRGTVKSMNGQTTIPTPSHPRLACPFMPLGGRACLINGAPFANLCVARRVTAPQADQLTTTAGPGVVIGFQSGSARPSSLTPSNRMGVTERATQPGVPLRRLEANHRHNKLTEQFIPSNVVGFRATHESVPGPLRDGQTLRHLVCLVVVTRHRGRGRPREVIVQHSP